MKAKNDWATLLSSSSKSEASKDGKNIEEHYGTKESRVLVGQLVIKMLTLPTLV